MVSKNIICSQYLFSLIERYRRFEKRSNLHLSHALGILLANLIFSISSSAYRYLTGSCGKLVLIGIHVAGNTVKVHYNDLSFNAYYSKLSF